MNADERGYNKKWLWLPAIAVALPALFPLIRDFTRTQHPQSEVVAIGALRTIHAAALAYEKNYGNGFPASLQALGPPRWWRTADCNSANLVDGALAAGHKKGYAFEYLPGPSVAEPRTGCPPGVRTFAITARPEIFEGRSFFVDGSGIIRFTAENRVADANDRILY